jgi:hypothetical protein
MLKVNPSEVTHKLYFIIILIKQLSIKHWSLGYYSVIQKQSIKLAKQNWDNLQ